MPSGRSVPTRLRTQGRHAHHGRLSGICLYVLFHRPDYESLFKRRLPQRKPVSRTNRGERGCFSSWITLTRFSREGFKVTQIASVMDLPSLNATFRTAWPARVYERCPPPSEG